MDAPQHAPDPGDLTRLHARHVAELQRRYEPALARAGLDGVVIHSGSQKTRSDFDDQYFALRPTPFFQHFVALAEPDCALVIRTGHRPRLLWPAQTSFWEKPAEPEGQHFRETLDVVEVASVAAIAQHLPAGARLGFIGEDRSRAGLWGIDAAAVNPAGLLRDLDAARVHKTAYEIVCLAEATRRAARGHEELRRRFLAGDESELDLHLAFLGATRQDDAETPYKNIVALGEHAATLHHISYSKASAARAAQSLLVDAGASFQGYCSDITRTWVKGQGATADAFAALCQAVEAMQQRLCAAVRVELPYEQLHDEAHRQVSVILRDLGLVRLSPDEIDGRGISRAFFPHGLGHSLGLQCHDVGCAEIKPRPDNPFLRNTTPVSVGQVFTIEPGVYFIDGLLEPLRAGKDAGAIDWRLCEALRALGGVRIEDDVEVTGPAAVRNLTREHLPVGGGRLG